MATVFLALPARLRISILIGVVCWAAGCSSLHTEELPASLFYCADSIAITNDNGTLIAEGKPFTGILYHLSPGGDTLFRLGYRNGKEQGEHVVFYGNGQLKEIRVYEEGKKVMIHTGYWPNGRQRYQYTFDDDLYEGIQFEWYESGKLFSRKNYAEGHENGLQQTWNNEGRLIANYETKNGRNYGNIGTKHCVTKK
jgi:antitoxin component YwqK of YwqJK toxin-antitoxin module